MSFTTDATRLIADAKIRLPGANDAVIRQDLFYCVDEFLKFSNAWTEDVPIAVLGDGVTTSYYIQTATDGLINRFMFASTSKGFPVRGSMAKIPFFVLVEAPTSADTYTITVALTVTDPTDTATNFPLFPEWILAKYRTDLLDGILGRMMAQPAKPYSSPQLSIFHMRRFNQAMAKAKIEAQHGNVYRGQQWKFPSRAFAGGRQRGSAGFGSSGVGQ